MALQIRVFVRKMSNVFATDRMWGRVARSDPVNIYKYNLALKELTIKKDENVKEYINFQSRIYKTCPTDLLKKLISESFEIVKEKNIVIDVDLYNWILKNYVINNINFDVNNLLQEMRDKKIEFNKETFSLLIEYYCNIGDMDNVEILLKEIKSRNEEVKTETKREIIKGYIIAGHSEKSKNYIMDNNLKENDPEIVTALLLGYSSVGQIDIVMEIIDKMKQDLNLSPNKYLQFYQRLAQANTPDSDLEKILLAMPIPLIEEIIDVILDLNRVELFDYSLKLLEKYKDKLAQQLLNSDLNLSFNTKNCPTEIYKQALTILLQFRCDNVCCNLFAYMDYNDATIFANNVINENNSKHIAASLVNKAINEKSIDKIEISLQFAMDKLDWKYFNMLLIFQYIPSMLENGLVSNCQELINLFPAFKKSVISASFIYCLMKKDFDQFSNLRDIYKSRNLFLKIKLRSLSINILNNYESMEDIDRLAVQVSTVFSPIFVNFFLSEIIVHKIINSAKAENISGIHDAIKMADNFDVPFTILQINNLRRKVHQYEDIIKYLSKKILPIKSNEE